LYIFPENRTDSKILQNGTIIDDITNNITKEIHFNKEEYKKVDNQSNIFINNTKNYDSKNNYTKNYDAKNNYTKNYDSKNDTKNYDSKNDTKNNYTKNEDEDDNLLNDFDEVLADEPSIEPVKRNIIIKKSNNEYKLDKNESKLDRNVCKFLIMTTVMPEVYGLYCKGNTGSNDKHSYASVPDMEVSNFLNMLFKDNTDNSTKIYVECKYHKKFKKWIPYKITDSMDSLDVINKIQIMLDAE